MGNVLQHPGFADGEVERARAYIAEVGMLLDRADRGELDENRVEWTSVASSFERALAVSIAARREGK